MNEPVKVFLAGEGKNELGGLIGHRSWQNEGEKGVLCALLKRVRAEGWVVGGVCEWKRIRKYRARGPVDAETRNVLAVALDAREAGCTILAFTRDQDNDERRRGAIDEGIRRVPEEFGVKAPDVIGGVAVPTLEGWILALCGERGTEALSPNQAARALEKRGGGVKETIRMVVLVEGADIGSVPDDATSLRLWLTQAHEVMARRLTG